MRKVPRFERPKASEPRQETLEMAKRNLEKTAWFGILEDKNRCLAGGSFFFCVGG